MSLIYVMSCHQIQLCAREHSPIHSTVRFKIRGRSTVLPIVPRGNMVCTARLRRESRGYPTFKGSSCGSSSGTSIGWWDSAGYTATQSAARRSTKRKVGSVHCLVQVNNILIIRREQHFKSAVLFSARFDALLYQMLRIAFCALSICN
jgi:hypothetical protein